MNADEARHEIDAVVSLISEREAMHVDDWNPAHYSRAITTMSAILDDYRIPLALRTDAKRVLVALRDQNTDRRGHRAPRAVNASS